MPHFTIQPQMASGRLLGQWSVYSCACCSARTKACLQRPLLQLAMAGAQVAAHVGAQSPAASRSSRTATTWCSSRSQVLYYSNANIRPGRCSAIRRGGRGHHACVLRVQAYIEPHLMRIARALLFRQGDPHSDESTYAHAHDRRLKHARSKDACRKERGSSATTGASDYMSIRYQILLRALAASRGARVVVALHAEKRIDPALGRWLHASKRCPATNARIRRTGASALTNPSLW